MSSISSPGLGSGLDVNSIVKSLVDAERVPFDKKKDKAQEVNTAKISSFGNIKSAMSELDDILFDLKLPFTFNERIVDTSSSKFTVEAGSASVTGDYDIEVLQLAAAHKMTSIGFTEGDPVGEGTMDFTVGSETFKVEISATDDLEAVKAKISDASNGLVTASILTADDGQHLTLTGTKTGAGNDIAITVTDIDGDITDGSGLSRLNYNGAPDDTFTLQNTAQDASIKVDNFLTVNSDTNSFDSVVAGAVITVTGTHTAGEKDKFSISKDEESIVTRLTEFIEAFNKVVVSVEEASDVNVDLDTAGTLVGDSTVRTMMNQIRTALSTPVKLEDGNVFSLSMMGISTKKDGSLELDAKELKDSVHTNFDDLSEIFASSEGIGRKLNDVVSEYRKFGGLIDQRITGLEESNVRWDEEQVKNEKKLSTLKDRLYSQFLSMDLLVAQLKATGDYLTTQLDNLPGFTSKN
ncbi:hypothetical protein CJF42_06470 [Pseudoalteromonas sp. NBT06-2]|uniref:flagellar filament capping protein FliD n=1 Tax=Pseudoalteromonas sp. NBT06-2 TaxID=2025950 RepID=UPI000BA67F20|nr:flagellar filament capping protein FliD [Pseudoalteromonas sp. NBT06-2]PAJ75131.1 hypothetical protein CJF42_06470 [Pseudoalteromonas sp. NBT06-2]